SRVHTGGHDHRAGVGEHGSQGVLQHQGVARAAPGGTGDDRHTVQVLGFDDVEEGLEQSAVGGVEDRRDGDEAVGGAEVLEHAAQFTGGHTGGHGVHDVVGQLATS